MNKTTLLAIAAFGGLVLLAITLGSNKENDSVAAPEIVVVSIPTDIPQFPIYPNTDVISVRDTDGAEARDISLSLSTPDSMSEIHKWYRNELGQNGWGVKSDRNVAGYQIIQGERENLYTSLQTANGTNGSVTISQSLKIRN